MFRERVLAAIALSGAIVAASAIVLETLPDGTVLVFGLGDGGIVREAYPYFSLVPYGFGNFGPFLAAILTCAALTVSVLSVFWYHKWIAAMWVHFSGGAFICSLMPIWFGAMHLTAVGVAIALALAAEFVLALSGWRIFARKIEFDKIFH